MDIIFIHGANQKKGEDPLPQWKDYILENLVGEDKDRFNNANHFMFRYADLKPNKVDATFYIIRKILELFISLEDYSENALDKLKIEVESTLAESEQFKAPHHQIIRLILQVIQGKLPKVEKLVVAIELLEAMYYVDSENYRDKIQTELKKVIGNKTDYVVVSHSLGTVITYDFIVKLKNEDEIRKIVTLGSPLGLDIFAPLRPEPKDKLEIPNCLQNKDWTNIFSEEDYIATYSLEAPHFPISPKIKNLIAKTDYEKPHFIGGYLKSDKFLNTLKEILSETNNSEILDTL